jgi:hypothetical protein
MSANEIVCSINLENVFDYLSNVSFISNENFHRTIDVSLL